MGKKDELKRRSEETGKSIDRLIDEALATSTSRTEAAYKLNISPQGLSLHLIRRRRQEQEVVGK